jgi:hypothetical protein
MIWTKWFPASNRKKSLLNKWKQFATFSSFLQNFNGNRWRSWKFKKKS